MITDVGYYVLHKDFYGNIKQNITDWFTLEYAKNENDYGSMYLDLDPTVDPSVFKIDDKLEIMRTIGGGPPILELGTQWLVRLARRKTDERGQRITHILAYDLTQILDRRIVAYAAQTSYTNKTGPIDNIMKAIVRENFGSLATDANRNISTYFLVPSDISGAPSITDTFARQKVLALLQTLAQKSTNDGTYLSFDVLKSSETTFTFHIFLNARGTDRGTYSGYRLTFSLENGNLNYASSSKDHTEEKNFIYAGGQGEEQNRVVKTAYNQDRINASPINRIEDWIDATSSPDPNSVQKEADSRLEEARPKIAINMHIQQSDECAYGLHYNFGDIVSVTYEGGTMDVHLDSLHVVCDGSGREDITMLARNLSDNEY